MHDRSVSLCKLCLFVYTNIHIYTWYKIILHTFLFLTVLFFFVTLITYHYLKKNCAYMWYTDICTHTCTHILISGAQNWIDHNPWFLTHYHVCSLHSSHFLSLPFLAYPCPVIPSPNDIMNTPELSIQPLSLKHCKYVSVIYCFSIHPLVFHRGN